MRTVTLDVASAEEVKRRVLQAFKGQEARYALELRYTGVGVEGV